MAAGFKDEAPRFDPVITRSMIIDEMNTVFDTNVDASAIEITNDLDVIRVLQGTVAPFNNGAFELYKDQSLGLVQLCDSSGIQLTQLRLCGHITYWHDYATATTKEELEEYKRSNILTSETANLDTTFLHMLGRTTFVRFQAEQSLEHFRRWPTILGQTLGPLIASII